MPCYTMRTITVSLEGLNQLTLKAGLESMGYTVTDPYRGVIRFSGVDKKTGSYVTGSHDGKSINHDDELDIEETKRAYARASILATMGSLGRVTIINDGLIKLRLNHTGQIIDIRIQKDGTVKIETSKIAPALHARVEDAFKKLKEKLGGETNITNLPHTHADTGMHIHHEQGIQH